MLFALLIMQTININHVLKLKKKTLLEPTVILILIHGAVLIRYFPFLIGGK